MDPERASGSSTRHQTPNPPGGRSEVRMASMKRGVGYCENTDCEDYAKGVFLLNHGDTFYCPRCRQLGKVEKERGFYTGNSDIFKEVRVEYNFDPINGVYREIAIVRDESLWGRNNVYTLQSPLIKTEKRALKVAEAILANLNRYRGLLNGDDIPRTTEIILSFDEPIRRVLAQAAAALEGVGSERAARRPPLDRPSVLSIPDSKFRVGGGFWTQGPVERPGPRAFGVRSEPQASGSRDGGRRRSSDLFRRQPRQRIARSMRAPAAIAREALVLAALHRLGRRRRARRRAARGTTGRACRAARRRRTTRRAASRGSSRSRRPHGSHSKTIAVVRAESRCARSVPTSARRRTSSPVSSRTSRTSASSSRFAGIDFAAGQLPAAQLAAHAEQHAACRRAPPPARRARGRRPDRARRERLPRDLGVARAAAPATRHEPAQRAAL